MPAETVKWQEGELVIIDQTLLPTEFKEITLKSLEAVWEAIKVLRVRGAPAIGVCAAFGVLVGVREKGPKTAEETCRAARESADYLATSRPTAVNLFWALDRMKRAADEAAKASTADAAWARLEAEGVEIFEEDLRLCRAIGEHGASLIADGAGVLTHCNAGSLATSCYGTALAGMFRAHELGRRFQVFADETRPLLQGARLTAWELDQEGIDVTLICDNMAAQVMREGKIQLVIVGADRIAANGDTANKIGTSGVAILARHYGIPFYVHAPFSTIDFACPSGAEIHIEERPAAEVTEKWYEKRMAPDGVKVYNPAFDVTDAALITAIVTERGVAYPPFGPSLAALAKAEG